MGHKHNIVLGAACALLCAVCWQARAQSIVLPDGKGKAEFVHNCVGVCHRAEMVVAAKKTPEDWRKSVDDMAARGTDGTKEDLDNVVLYLVTNYSTEKPAAGTEPVPPSSPHNGTLLSVSDFGRMKSMLEGSVLLVSSSRVEAKSRPQGRSRLISGPEGSSSRRKTRRPAERKG